MVRAQPRGLLELTRPVNAVAAGVLTGIGAFVATGSPDPIPVAAAIGATIVATAGGNAINDYFDRDVDRINDPDRPIPRGAVSPRAALAYSLVLFGVAIGLAVTLPPVAIAIAAINLVALVSYTELFKGTPGAGNALVAYLGGSTFLFGGAAVESVVGPPIVLALLAATSTLAREIIKDVEDVEGDRAEGLRTLPVVIGEQKALWIATVLLLVAALASPIPYLRETFGLVYLAVVAPAVAIMLYAGYEGFDDPAASQSHLKYGMFLAAISFVVGRLAGTGL